MANEVVHYYEPGKNITGKAVGAVTGGRFAQIDAGSTAWAPEGLKATATPNVVPVETCAAGAKALGVFQKDAADGATVGVIGSGVVPVTAGAAVTHGSEVEVGTAGKAIALNTGKAVGLAMSSTTADGQTLAVKLY